MTSNTNDKQLTPEAKRAAARVREAGLAFTLIGGRPPRGPRPLVEEPSITSPVAGFNGGAVAGPDLALLTEHAPAPRTARRA